MSQHWAWDKYEYYGICGMALIWIKRYLTNRKQIVTYDNQISERLSITCGVPQGSILGPLLFLLYVNDLPNVSEKPFSILFADDTNVFNTGNNMQKKIN